jgi:threonine efflux protein
VNDVLELLAFAGIMALAQFSPGPDMILLTRTSLNNGGRAGALMATGIATGLAVHATIALSGTGYLFTMESPFLPYLKSLASGYLLYLAWLVFRSSPHCDSAETPADSRHYLRGLLCNLLNPKAALVLSSMCAPFLSGHQGLNRPLALGGIIVGQGALLWVAWAYMLQNTRLRNGYQRYSNAINRCFASILVLLATMLWWR